MACVPRPEHEAASNIARSLRHSRSGQGFIHLAADGVYRSFSSTGEVVDYKQLSPEEIEIVVKFHEPYADPEAMAKFKEKMKGVDGRSVTNSDELLHPGPGIRPAQFNQ